MSYQLVITGDAGVGKTSLFRKFTKQRASDDLNRKTVNIGTEGENLQIWDIATQERLETVRRVHFRRADIVFVVYDVNERSTFENVPAWVNEIKETNDGFKLILLGNKRKATNGNGINGVSLTEGQKLALELNAVAFFETNALNGANVDAAFMAGIRQLVVDPVYLSLFKDILRSVKKAPWMRSKLMVIGQGRSGKTATVRSLVSEPFKPDLESTIGVELTRTQIVSSASSSSLFEKVDDAGATDFTTTVVTKEMAKRLSRARKKEQEESRYALRRQGSGSKTSKILRESRKKLSRKLSLSRRSQNSASEEPPMRKSNEPLPLMTEEDVASKFDVGFFTKALASENSDSVSFTIWDYGGQHVFYTLHHLFLTKYGTYLLVFDMRQFLGHTESAMNESIYNLKFWLNSVRIHAPKAPIILVGTFSDEVSDFSALREVNSVVERIVRGYEQVVPNEHESLLFFPIDNTCGEGKHDIAEAIELVTREQRFIHRKISLKWLRCLDLINEESKPWLSLDVVKSLARSVDITSQSEVAEMLGLFNELGAVVYIPATGALRKIVTKDPQWLIDCLSKVIRDGKLHQFDMLEIEKAGLRADVDNLFERAVVSLDLLHFLWEKEEVDYLLDLMKRTLLLSDWSSGSSGNGGAEKSFLVPSLLSNVKFESGKISPMSGKYMFVFDFASQWLPIGVFERLICLAVAHSNNTSPSRAPVLSNNVCTIWFGQEWIELTRDEEGISCVLDKPDIAATTLSMLNSMLTKIHHDVMNGRLAWEVKIKTSKGFISWDEAKKRVLRPWFPVESTIIRSKEGEIRSLNLDSFLGSFR